MSQAPQALPANDRSSLQSRARLGSLTRILRYSSVRILSLLLTVVIGVYLTIIIANMGGHVDNFRKAEIREGVQAGMLNDRALLQMTDEERKAILTEMQNILYDLRASVEHDSVDRPSPMDDIDHYTR